MWQSHKKQQGQHWLHSEEWHAIILVISNCLGLLINFQKHKFKINPFNVCQWNPQPQSWIKLNSTGS